MFDIITRKSEAAGKDNIQSNKKKIQALDIKVKGMDIEHFHNPVYHLTNELEAHGIIILDIMNHLFKAYKVGKNGYFRKHLT